MTLEAPVPNVIPFPSPTGELLVVLLQVLPNAVQSGRLARPLQLDRNNVRDRAGRDDRVVVRVVVVTLLALQPFGQLCEAAVLLRSPFLGAHARQSVQFVRLRLARHFH